MPTAMVARMPPSTPHRMVRPRTPPPMMPVTAEVTAADTWWRPTTSSRTGIPILIGVIAAMFVTLFVVGDVLSRLLTGAWAAWVSPAVTSAITGVIGDGVLGRTILWGVDGGILATIAVGICLLYTSPSPR